MNTQVKVRRIGGLAAAFAGLGLLVAQSAQAQVVVLDHEGSVQAGAKSSVSTDPLATSMTLSADSGDTTGGQAYGSLSAQVDDYSIHFVGVAGGQRSASGPQFSRDCCTTSRTDWQLVINTASDLQVLSPYASFSRFAELSSLAELPSAAFGYKTWQQGDVLTAGTYAFKFSAWGYGDGRGDYRMLDLKFAPVPEPATWGLMSLGLLGLHAATRRRARNRA